MTVKELKEQLRFYNDEMEVVIFDYTKDDGDEEVVFHQATGLEIIDVDGGSKILSIYHNVKE